MNHTAALSLLQQITAKRERAKFCDNLARNCCDGVCIAIYRRNAAQYRKEAREMQEEYEMMIKEGV